MKPSSIMLVLFVVALLSAGTPLTASARLISTADLVIVEKSQRKLHLVSNGHVFRSYDIALGANPVGHKLYKGDGRTPEGRYYLDWRNPQSRFHKSMHISYPNERDRERAQRLGRSPGGHIMIHGIPNRYRRAPELFEGLDWTEGCIAVRNEDMEEIWQLVADHTPIEIYP
ncbi:L,D-transpeptidase catalytic domain [Geoalkalibacter ferrihydriticus]|uniref:ErfK/YbiS/YcfS/YnhG family protein n=2 Tax=Geoalkalibacter ferrihydriticus TaxID=392333 RepID=A0A0C2EAU1_9BACT|nr:L,D-transpeptidase family protein [Geoalkalibacter ferrihydriticus]KIH75678.1 ErfK/YbiS/YcfS/YnhG family protein [Geoalkalibacter ferrihydriticus DSM 17813]SDM73215.1 L,D-transpeptidase catalytic domain [Geoalkalibacter ferrihydriticus]